MPDVIERMGPAPRDAATTVILVHGRGARAADFIALSRWIDVPNVAYLAPQAPGQTWYPLSFLAPIEQNQPWLDESLDVVDQVIEGAGVGRERVVLVGFSQGACLVSEYAYRHPTRYAGVAALTGGLIGPPGTRWAAKVATADFKQTPIFFGASDPDPHVPFTRVSESADVFTALGATVTLTRYPGQPHMIGEEQIAVVRRLISDASGKIL